MYDKYKGVIEVKGCYYNVATILMKMGASRISDDIKIAFGAWQVPLSGGDNIFAKHCFFLKDGEIIDPTYFAAISDKDNDNRETHKHLFAAYMNKNCFEAYLTTRWEKQDIPDKDVLYELVELSY